MTNVINAPLIKLNGKIPNTNVFISAEPVSIGKFKKYAYIGKKTR